MKRNQAEIHCQFGCKKKFWKFIADSQSNEIFWVISLADVSITPGDLETLTHFLHRQPSIKEVFKEA